MNLAKQMIRAGSDYAAYPATAKRTTVLHSYAELADRVRRIAAALIHYHGLQPGDRVALIMHNGPEYLELLYATWHAGLVVVPINAKLHANEFRFILDNSGASLCFASDSLLDVVRSVTSPSLPCIGVDSDEYRSMPGFDPAALVSRQADDAAWLFYTSGTTGQPKGAILSHRNLTTMCECYFADVDPVEPWSAMLHAAPMSHGSGLYALPYVIKGGCHVFGSGGGFDPAEIFELIEGWPGIAFFAAPTMVNRLLAHDEITDTSNLKAIIYGGGPMYVEDCLAALKRFDYKLTQLYGQGESPMTITALDARAHADTGHPRYLERLASVGVAQSKVTLKISGKDGNELPAGEVGEILVRGPSVMLGYWKNPEATREALRDGWLHTGDYGVLDDDGYLTLKDRAKDLVISGGSNIYPREVEEVLIRHPQVAEAAVIGRKDREWGEIVVAYLVGVDGVEIDIAAVDGFCKGEIARFKRPRLYRQIDALPKNNYGKVLKRDLRALEEQR